MKVKLFIIRSFCVSSLLMTGFCIQNLYAQELRAKSITMPGATEWLISSSGSANILRFVPKVGGDWAWGSQTIFESDGDVKFPGGVAIGSSSTHGYRLAVNGNIRAKEIRVNTNWSDFVFEEDYSLPTLDEIESHIKAHKHLPDIPSAAEVEAEGVELGVISSKLLQKIEELTLYVIAQEKRISEQQMRVEMLEKKLLINTDTSSSSSH